MPGVEVPDGFSIEAREETPNAVHLAPPPFAGFDDGQSKAAVGGYGVYVPEENVRELGWG